MGDDNNISNPARKQRDWTSVVRDKALEAQAPVPADAWAQLEAKLNAAPAVHAARHRSARVWPWVAAAAVMVGVIASLLLPRRNATAPAQLPATPAAITQAKPASTTAEAATAPAAAATTATSRASVAPAALPNSVAPLNEEFLAQRAATTGNAAASPAAASPAAAADITTPAASLIGPQPLAQAGNNAGMAADTTQGSYGQEPIFASGNAAGGSYGLPSFGSIPSPSHESHDYEINAYGSGLAMAFGNSQNAAMRSVMVNAGNGMMLASMQPITYGYKHKMPVMVGLRAYYGVYGNLLVGTGVTYTSLSSDVWPENFVGPAFTQRVQLIGIPMGVKWNFLHFGNFATYVAGEALMERVIDARFGDDKLTIKRLQWSVHASAGLQYNPWPHVGVFAEPRLSHYITDLPLTTLRGEHSVNFNVHFGLSFDF